MDDKYLSVRPGDLEGKPYARFWNPEMRPLREPVLQALAEGPVASELGFLHEAAAKLLRPGYLPLETGFTRLGNGQVFVAVLTPMPGVSGDMIDWWFGWHGGEKERYKLWHPRAHVHVRSERELSGRPDLSDREKYVGNISHVEEYIGCEYNRISITFQAPADNHLDENLFADAEVSTAVCARVGFTGRPFYFARLIHLIRETEHGSEMRSRFWLGDVELGGFKRHGIVNRALRSRAVSRKTASLAMGRDLVVHCAQEMQHLAGFLPELYEQVHADLGAHDSEQGRPAMSAPSTRL